MSPDDWHSYSARRKETHHLATRLASAPSVNFPSDFPTFLKPFEDFCSLALARNDAFAQTLLAKMKETKSNSAVLVAGGFHTEGLLKNLKTQGASYVVLTPKIEKIDSAKNYLDVFAHDPLPLEKLFTGEPIALLTERALATDSTLAKQMHAANLAAHLSAENKALQTQGLPVSEILDALGVFLTGLQTLVGARLTALSPKIINVSPKDGVTFTILVQGMIHWMRANSNGSVTSTTPTPQITNRAHRLYVEVREWLASLIRDLIPEQKMMTQEGIIFSAGETKSSSNVVAIQPLPPEITLYINQRGENGAYQNLRNYIWKLFNGQPSDLSKVVNSLQININLSLKKGQLHNAISLIEVLGYLSSDKSSIEFLEKIDLKLVDSSGRSLLETALKDALRWMKSNQSHQSQMETPESMFYGPFVPVIGESLNNFSDSRHRWISLEFQSREAIIETVVKKDETGRAIFDRKKNLVARRSSQSNQGFAPLRIVGDTDKNRTKRTKERSLLGQTIINDYLAFRWLQLLNLGVINAKLEVDKHGNIKIIRSVSVTNGKTTDLKDKNREIEGLLDLAAFPTMNGVESIIHLPYNGPSGFFFDLENLLPTNDNDDGKLAPNQVRQFFKDRFRVKWFERITDPSSLERLLVRRMNSVPREEMQALIEQSYSTVYGAEGPLYFSTEIENFLDNWDTIRTTLAEYYVVPPFSQPQTSDSTPVAHYEGMKLINGGATQVAGQEVTPASLNEVKDAVKQNANRFDIPSSKGNKVVYVANEILQEHQSFGYQSQPDFEGALKKHLTEQFNHSPPLTDEIVIAMLNQSSHLFEDHQGNGFIGVNKQILDLNSPRLARHIFWMGLGHELAHESQGALEGKPLRDFEETQEKKDRRAFWQFQRSPTNEERQSLATIITPGTFKLISHFNSETQPVYQFATTPLLDPNTQIPINTEGLEKYFVAPGTTANRVSGFLRENDNPSYRELTLKDPENPELQVVIRKVYLGPKSTHVSYAVDKANIYNLVNLFGLKRVEDFSAEAPGPGDVVITKNGVERMGLPTRKAVALSHKLNSAFGPLTTARQGQKSDPFMSNGQKIVGEAKMIAGVPVWTVTRADWETINSTPPKEMGASGLLSVFGIRSLGVVTLAEDTLIALSILWGMTYFDLAPVGDSLAVLVQGFVEVSFALGPLILMGLFLLHFLTGVIQPGGGISKITLSEILYAPKIFLILKIFHHARVSFRATGTASASPLLMLPFFSAAAVLNIPALIVIGFVLASTNHFFRDKEIERERLENEFLGGKPKTSAKPLAEMNLTSQQNVPMVQPVTIIKESQPELSEFATALKEIVPDTEGPLQFGFSHTERHYEVTPQPPTPAKPYLEFLEQLSGEISPTNLEFYANAIELLGMTKYSIRGIIKSAKEDEMFRRVLSRWALAELLLASQGDPKWYSSSPFQREAFQLEQFILLHSNGEVLPLSRLERAAQMAAILRAAGSSISDPYNRGDPEENQKRDQSLLMTAWGLAGNPNPTEIPETYNEILRTVATATLWTDIINRPTSDKTPKTVYFNIDAILDGRNEEAAEKAAQAVEIIAERQMEDKNIRLVLVTTLPPQGRTNRELISQYTMIMTQRYGGWLSVLSKPNLISLNDTARLIDPESGYLRLSTLLELSSQSGYPTIEFWTHEPQKVIKVPGKDIRIVDFVSIGNLIGRELQKIFFFLIQA
jgi:hypothetical protein